MEIGNKYLKSYYNITSLKMESNEGKDGYIN